MGWFPSKFYKESEWNGIIHLMVNGININDREKQKRLVNFYIGFIFIKENDLQSGQSRKKRKLKENEYEIKHIWGNWKI